MVIIPDTMLLLINKTVINPKKFYESQTRLFKLNPTPLDLEV